MIRESIRQGLQQVGVSKRLVAWYYVWNVGVALVVALPLWIFLNKHLSMSMLGEQRFSFSIFTEMTRYQPVMQKTLSLLLLLGVALFLIIRFWFSAGLFHYFYMRYSLTISQFLAHATRLFGRFFKLFITCIPAFFVIFIPLIIYAIGMGKVLGNDPSQIANYWNSIIKIVLFLLSLQLCGLVFDYARYHTLANDNSRLITAAFQGFIFLWRHVKYTVGLAWTVSILGLGLVLIYLLLSFVLFGHHVLVLLLLIMLQHVYLIARIVLWCVAVSAEAYVYTELSNEARLRRSIEDGTIVEPV